MSHQQYRRLIIGNTMVCSTIPLFIHPTHWFSNNSSYLRMNNLARVWVCSVYNVNIQRLVRIEVHGNKNKTNRCYWCRSFDSTTTMYTCMNIAFLHLLCFLSLVTSVVIIEFESLIQAAMQMTYQLFSRFDGTWYFTELLRREKDHTRLYCGWNGYSMNTNRYNL